MPVHLLDVNVLVALSWPQHVHHNQARSWFDAHSAEGWATCPITQCGFVRISSNPKIMGAAAAPQQAVAALRQLMNHPDHVFWPDDLTLIDQRWRMHETIIGHQQVTDAYLVGLAGENGGQLATLDRRIISNLPADKSFLVAVIQ